MPASNRGGFHHIDLNVSNLAASRHVYGLVLEFLGYTMVKEDGRACEWDLGPEERRISLGLRAAEPEAATYAHRRYAPGLHHLAWRAASRDEVDAVHRLLVEHDIRVLDPPAHYPEYSPTYYAVFFEDPDGMKLEVLHEG